MAFSKLFLALSARSTGFIIISAILVKVFLYALIALLLFLLGAKLRFSNLDISWNLFWSKALFPAFLETLLFQFLILNYYERLRLNRSQAIWISAILFGLAHFQSPIYILYEIPMGILYAVTYLILHERKAHPFLWVMGIHLLWNSVMLWT